MKEVDPKLANLALGAAKAVKHDFAGVDILQNKETGEYTVLEVNTNFGTPYFGDEKTEKEFYKKIESYFTQLARERSEQ